MKKFISLFMGLFLSLSMFAQRDVTKFLGIPVDGTKQEMIQKLKEKGFVWDARMECLKGEFNGTDVHVSVATNSNKVWRVMVIDIVLCSESQIRIRYNKLCAQFENNSKYINPVSESQVLPETENIEYEIIVHDKQYQALYFQRAEPVDSLTLKEYCIEKWTNRYNAGESDITPEELNANWPTYEKIFESYYYGQVAGTKQVWFTIFRRGSQYGIAMYYDNTLNAADGEDL